MPYHPDHSRAKNVASHTHEHNEVQQLIAEIVLHQLHLPYLVVALERMPKIREETRLIHEYIWVKSGFSLGLRW